MDLGISGRVALVSGADSGMGKVTARLLLEEGGRVAITDRGGGDLDAALADFGRFGDVIAIAADHEARRGACAVPAGARTARRPWRTCARR